MKRTKTRTRTGRRAEEEDEGKEQDNERMETKALSTIAMKYEQITELAAGYTISEDSTIDNGPFGFHCHHNYFRSPSTAALPYPFSLSPSPTTIVN